MHYLLLFLTSLLVTGFCIPSIIKVAFRKRLFDIPTEQRKIHKRIVPNFGGIAIFTAFLFSASLFIPSAQLPVGNVLMAGGLIMFMTGLKDDIVGLSPMTKFIAQFATALIISLVADIRITNMQGLFEITQLNYPSSILLTVFFIVGMVNAFNLIDGIDGLAGSLGLILSLSYTYIFFKAGDLGFSYMAIALAGALLGFLFFNITPAKIFMGDSGSLILGFLSSIFTIRFLATDQNTEIILGSILIQNQMGIAFAIIIVPVFDTLRVFTLRILSNKSPFTADSNHLHHRLLFLGLSHLQATLALSFTTVLFIILALTLNDFTASQSIAIIFVAVILINGLLSIYIEQYKKSFFRLREQAEGSTILPTAVIKEKHAHRDIFSKIFKN
jgi:UDP-GlcNAc:undecaprenyl-phosphate GlcNAc-1-phosphate transferase